MAIIKEIKRSGIESITIELTEREAQLVRILTGLGSMHLSGDAGHMLHKAGLSQSPYSVGAAVNHALTTALRLSDNEHSA